MRALIACAPAEDRPSYIAALQEWLRSNDALDRYDAGWLTDELHLTENLDVVRELRDRAQDRTDPRAPYDWSKWNDIAGRLLSN
jgi:hypothetical protein